MIDLAGYELEFEDTFDGEVLDESRWLPYYLPQWSSRAASAARYRLGDGLLRLRIEADQQPWCPEFDDAIRVSSLQTGVFAGPVGSPVGQLHFAPGLVVRHPFGDPGIRDEFSVEVVPVDVREFHRYTAEWTPEYVTFYVDHRLVKTVEQAPSYPMQFMLAIYEFPATAASSAPPAPTSPSPTESPSPSTPPPQWRALPPAPSQRSEVTGAALGNRIYLTGGLRTGGYTTDRVEIFDTTSGRWSIGPGLPIGVNHAMSAAAAGTLFVFGGYLGDYRVSAAAYRLDGTRWRRIADLPAGRAAGTAAVVGDRVYLAGGVAPDHSLADQMLVYEPGADKWSTVPGPPTHREHLGGAALDGRVYTVGGRTSHAAGVGNLDAVEAFDPATGQWTALPGLPTARGGLAAAATCDGRVVAVGGEGSATFPQVEAFDPKSGRWQALTPLPNPRHGLGVVMVGKVLYVLTGGPKPGPYMSNTAEALDLCP